ncbi:MAG: helix-turn-helix transcriptional regulator [Microbacteriaceae bacterium]
MVRAAGNPASQAGDKLTFLLALVPYLIECERVSVSDAAAHFSVSEDQIIRAVKLIAVSGVPGETGTYQSEDLFDIAWDDLEENGHITLTHLVALDDAPRFSAREAAALIAGLQYLSSLPENADSAAIASLMSKLTRGSSSEPSQVAIAPTATNGTLSRIREAVETGKRIDINYINSQGVNENRSVDPLRVESVDADWYLRGWCHLRGAVRTFRLDRITSIFVTDLPMGPAAADVELPETLFEASADDLVITIEVATSAESLIADYVPDGAVRVQNADTVQTTMRVSHFHGLKRLIAGMPGVATVVGPPEARELVAQWAQSASERYESGSVS